MTWFIAGLGIGFAAGVMTYRYFKKFSKDKEFTTEDCVEMLKNKGYWVNLNVSPKVKK